MNSTLLKGTRFETTKPLMYMKKLPKGSKGTIMAQDRPTMNKAYLVQFDYFKHVYDGYDIIQENCIRVLIKPIKEIVVNNRSIRSLRRRLL